MASTALKSSLKTDLIELIRDGLTNKGNYYLFVGRSFPYEDNADTPTIVENDSNPPSVGESSRNLYDTYRNMLFIKRIQSSNMRIVIPRVDWISGSVYDPYTETKDMAGKRYYVMTSENNVYKCMGGGGSSTVMPTGRSTETINTSDGYRWKYIYSVAEDFLGFVTLDYIPVYVAAAGEADRVDQKLVQETAKPGSIDLISFNAALSPSFEKLPRGEFVVTSVNNSSLSTIGITPNVAGSSYISFIPVSDGVPLSTSYWNGYAINVVSGSGVGQYFRILNFIGTGGAGNSYFYANVSPSISRSLNPVNNSPTLSRIRIVPNIVVDGDGIGAIVTPRMSFDKFLTGMNIVNSGTDYTYAKPRITTEVSGALGPQISQLNDSISVQLSPPIGHGTNAIKEFMAADLMIVVDVEGAEGEKILVSNDYRQFGIVKDPYLYGGTTLAGSQESISQRILVKKQASKTEEYENGTFITGNYIVGRNSRATAKILSDRKIMGSDFHELDVTDVIGNFILSDESSLNSRVFYDSSFSGTFVTGDNAFQYSGITGLTLSASGKVLSFNTSEKSILIRCDLGAFVEGKSIFFTVGSTLGSTFISDIDEEFGELIGQFSLGVTGGSRFLTFGGDENFGRIASTTVDRINVEDFGEYRLTHKMIVSHGGGSVTNPKDATLQQTNSGNLKKTTATIVDYVVFGNTGTFHLNNLTGTFNTTDQLSYYQYGSTAENALTGFTISSIVNPEIEIGSGELLYIENVRPIERNNEQSEEFKIVLGF